MIWVESFASNHTTKSFRFMLQFTHSPYPIREIDFYSCSINTTQWLESQHFIFHFLLRVFYCFEDQRPISLHQNYCSLTFSLTHTHTHTEARIKTKGKGFWNYTVDSGPVGNMIVWITEETRRTNNNNNNTLQMQKSSMVACFTQPMQIIVYEP